MKFEKKKKTDIECPLDEEEEAVEREYRGCRPKYSKLVDLKKAIDAYFDRCDAQGVFPDEAGMMIQLKLRKKDIERLTDDETNPRADLYRDVFEEAMLRRKSDLMRRMVSDPKIANGCMNALKQLENGGLTDKPLENMDRTVHVKVAASDEELFK